MPSLCLCTLVQPIHVRSESNVELVYMMPSDGASHRLVSNAVYLQRNSPNFAEFCIAHVTSPNYQFLFSQEDTEERRLYQRLLDEARQGGASDAARMKRSLFRKRASTVAEGDEGFSPDDVRALWGALHHRIVRPNADLHSSTRKDPGPCSGFSTASRLSPHIPLTFSSPKELQQFMMDVLHAAENPQKENVEDAVEYMLGRLPMTESFLLVITYLVEELLGFARMRYPPHRGLQAFSELDEDEKASEHRFKRRRPDRSAAAAAESDEFLTAVVSQQDGGGGPANPAAGKEYQEVNFYMEAAGTVLFIAAMLFARHRSRESQLPKLCVATRFKGTPCLPKVEEETRGLYYQRAFDYYLLRMVRGFARTSEVLCRNAARSFPVFEYVTDTLRMWLEDEYFLNKCTRSKAESILRQMPVISEGSVDNAER